MAISMRRLHLGCGEGLSGERYQLVASRKDGGRRTARCLGSSARDEHNARLRKAKQQ